MYLKSQENYRAAVYLRLSNEDGDKGESNSIRNQRSLITEFINRQNDIILGKEYVDDGYSGTNFERPGFQRMMEDINDKKINCIIVKDLSRLGRNYIETGRYMEKIFPLLGVRFIAINDHIDTTNIQNDAEQIIVPFKNLINDAYCRDISIKIRSQLEIKRKNGQFTGSFAGYGYQKDPKDKNHLIIDETAAEVVQLIFNMKLDGYSMERIAERLDSMGVLTPMEYKRQCGYNFNSGFRSGENPKWSVSTVRRILTNELYTGMMVQGKNRKINYKVKESKPVPRENWVRVDGMHEAIVSRKLFDCVQTLLKIDTRTSPHRENVYLFSGLLKCGDCGQNMARRIVNKKGKQYFYYCCSHNKATGECSYHNISEKIIYDTVLAAIQNQIELIIEADEMIAEMDHVPQQQIGVGVINSQIVELHKEIEKYKNLKAKLYQDMVDQIIEQDEYTEISETFARKIQKATTQKEELEQKKDRLIHKNVMPQQWADDFRVYRNIQTLERKILVILVKEIRVYSTKQIEITFNCENEIAELLQCALSEPDKKESEVAAV